MSKLAPMFIKEFLLRSRFLLPLIMIMEVVTKSLYPTRNLTSGFDPKMSSLLEASAIFIKELLIEKPSVIKETIAKSLHLQMNHLLEAHLGGGESY